MEVHYLCELTSLEEGVFTPHTINGVKFVVVKFDETVKAYQALCPHMKYPLSRFGRIENGILTCAHAGIEFNAETGRYLKTSPECDSLKVYEVIVDEGIVAVRLPSKKLVRA